MKKYVIFAISPNQTQLMFAHNDLFASNVYYQSRQAAGVDVSEVLKEFSEEEGARITVEETRTPRGIERLFDKPSRVKTFRVIDSSGGKVLARNGINIINYALVELMDNEVW